MNPINLLLPDGMPSKVWACGECHLACDDAAHAEKCCDFVPCNYCGKPTEKKARYNHEYEFHGKCRREYEATEATKRLETAEKLETWDGWVHDGNRGWNEGFFPSLEEYLDFLSSEVKPEDWPAWVHVCESRIGVDLDLGSILESACDDGYEDMADDLHGEKELDAAIKAFNEANASVIVYDADYSRAVRVPKPTPAPSPTEAPDA